MTTSTSRDPMSVRLRRAIVHVAVMSAGRPLQMRNPDRAFWRGYGSALVVLWGISDIAE